MSSMSHDLLHSITQALTPFRFQVRGEWLREGVCPGCSKKALWTRRDAPWVLRCSRLNNCGYDAHAKELFPDLFNNWSERFPVTDEHPTASADAYLHHARGLTITGLRSAYAQDQFFAGGEGTATVRFSLPGGGWWERLIDRPWRFGDMKARFAKGVSYAGEAWSHPADDAASFAAAGQVWFCEGIFDALSLREHDLAAASLMSSTNYPERLLARIRAAVAAAKEANPSAEAPELVFALDSDKAGRDQTKKFVERARAEGWEAWAAQIPQPDGGKKLDWNDLHLRHINPAAGAASELPFSEKSITTYLWRGDLLLAKTARAKAILLYQRAEAPTFPFEFRRETYWANVDPAKLAEQKETLGKEGGFDPDELHEAAVERVLKVSQIANCHPRPLYFQIDRLTDESWYFYKIELPNGGDVKNTFTPAQIAKAQPFKERLLAISPLASFTGNTTQLDRLHNVHQTRLRTVEAIGFVGYSREHRSYVFNDLAVKDGRMVRLNADDYFDLGKVSVKSVDRSVDLTITPWDDKADWAWLDDLWTAFGPKGLVALTFWFGSFFAEQLRDEFKSYPFLELAGLPDKGKTTLIEFLWKLCGRQGYEGFDPSKATFSALARNFAQVGNLPVVLMEGDREKDTAAARKFDFNELKTLYNGRSIRSRGVRTSGNETYEPPFRGAVVLEQNAPIETSGDAIPTRLVHLYFDGAGYSEITKAAAMRLERRAVEEVSGFLIASACAERAVLAKVVETFPVHEALLLRNPMIAYPRIAKCHGQMLALLDALALVAPLRPEWISQTRAQLTLAAEARKLAIAAEHPIVEAFWEAYDHLADLEVRMCNGADVPLLNHAHDRDLIAISLTEFGAVAAKHRVSTPDPMELKRHLSTSKVRRFVAAKDVKSIHTNKSRHCWVFQRPTNGR